MVPIIFPILERNSRRPVEEEENYNKDSAATKVMIARQPVRTGTYVVLAAAATAKSSPASGNKLSAIEGTSLRRIGERMLKMIS